MQYEITTNSAEETIEVAKNFSKELLLNEKILLYGELGSGKTTFIKGIAEGLNIKNYDEVVSPSFVIIREYKIDSKSLFHVDLYRIQDNDIFILREVDELIRTDELILIEWAERIKYTEFPHIKIKLEYINENSRIIKISHF